MGTLNEGLALTILRNFQLAKLDAEVAYQEDLQARLSRPPTWSWTPGTFVFPEGLCCYCGGVMRSAAIWRAKDLQFYGSWKVAGKGSDGYFVYDDSHPHVMAGAICMGGGNYRASSVADALFLAFNPLSSYFAGPQNPETGMREPSTNQLIKAWFAERFDHTCGVTGNAPTIAGIDNRHLVAAEDGCHCQHCRMHRGEVHCQREGCGEWYDPRAGHGRFTCQVCNRRGTIKFCFEHKHEQRTCVTCGESQDVLDLLTGAQLPEDQIYIAKCPGCEEYVCGYCLNETEDHDCGSDGKDSDEDADEDEGHSCCGCDICCECGQDNS